MVKKKLQICCSSTLAMLLIVCLFVSGIVHAEEPLTQADELLKSKKYDQAKALFQSAAQNSSDSSLAIKGLTGVGRCEIQLGNNAAAEQVIGKLKTDYSQHPDLCARLDDLSYEYWQKADYAKSKILCQYIIQKSPADSLAVRVQRGIARAEIRLGNKAAADQAVEVLMNDFSQHEDLCEQLSVLSYEYRVYGDYARSKSLCEFILQNSPDTGMVIKARAGIVHCEIGTGDDLAVDQAVIELKDGNSENQALYPELSEIAGRLFRQEKYDKAKSLYQYVVQNSSDSSMAIGAQKLAVIMEIWSGNDSAADAAIVKLKKDFSAHPQLCQNIYEIAMKCWFNKKFAKAKGLYYFVSKNSSDKKTVFTSLGRALKCELRLDNHSALAKAVESLNAESSASEDYVDKVLTICGVYI